MKTLLNIKFYLEEPWEHHPVFKTALYGKQHEHHIRISTIVEVNETILSLIKKSYHLFNPMKY